MDAFTQATTWQYSAFLGTGNGNVWRLWFGSDGLPIMEMLTADQMFGEYREAVSQLERECERL